MSTPYQKYKQYFRNYHRNYWRTHKYYRDRQKQIKRKRYRANNEKERLRVKKYVSAIYSRWYDGTPSQTIGHEKLLAAKKVAVEKILPKEGFRRILWPETVTRGGHGNVTSFWVFDALAYKGGKPCAIQITTSPSRQIRNNAMVSAFLQFLGMQLYVCQVRPNLEEYHLSKYSSTEIPSAVVITMARMRELKRINEMNSKAE
ncbi:MAG: hypothetical protein ABSC50_06810 [Candidatus Bathyarchaeia archaeon]